MKRHRLACDGFAPIEYGPLIDEHPDGDWVKYEDARAHADQQRAIGAAQERERRDMAMAVKVINLRQALETANQQLKDAGRFGVLCQEDDGPTFQDGRRFWAEARALEQDHTPPCPGIWHGAGELRGPKCSVCGAKAKAPGTYEVVEWTVRDEPPGVDFEAMAAMTAALHRNQKHALRTPCPGIWHGPGASADPECTVCGATDGGTP